MAVIDHIDAPTRRIFLHSDTVGIDLEPMDIYREMRTFRRVDESLRPFDVFLAGLGRDPKVPGKFTEKYTKCLLGTRIVPFDATQTLTVTGTIISDDGVEGVDCFDKTSLSPGIEVDIHYEPKQVEIVEVGGTPAEITAAVWSDTTVYAHGTKGHSVQHLDHMEHVVFIDTELAPEIGNGSEFEPFGVTSTAITYAETHGFLTLGLRSELTLDRHIKNFTIKGIGSVPVLNTDGFNIDRSTFFQVRLRGVYSGAIIARDCLLGDGVLTNLNGEFNNCAITGSVEIPDGAETLINRCSSLKVDFVPPLISIGGETGTAKVSIMGHVGGLHITDMNQPTDSARITTVGPVIIDASCVAGQVNIMGNVRPIDNSGPGCIVNWWNVDAQHISDMYTRLGLDVDNPFTDTPSLFRSADGDIEIDISGDGVTTTTQTRR